jgi:cell division protein FtsW (lipid II flippase)
VFVLVLKQKTVGVAVFIVVVVVFLLYLIDVVSRCVLILVFGYVLFEFPTICVLQANAPTCLPTELEERLSSGITLPPSSGSNVNARFMIGHLRADLRKDGYETLYMLCSEGLI